jgi:hypothetical protein
MDLDDDEEAEIRDEAVLLHFAATLQKAQEVAAAAEREAWETKKCPKRYDGSSSRTLRRHAAKRRKIAASGTQPFIQSFFQPKVACNTPNLEVSDSENSDSEDECEVIDNHVLE